MVWTGRLRLGLVAVAATVGAGMLAAGPATAAVHADSTWGTAITVPGIAALNNGNSQVTSMSCPAAGGCTAIGTYQRQGNRIFVTDETGGTWGNAEQLPGMATLNKGNVFLTVDQVSCGRPGNCVAGGGYTDASDHGQGWLATETGGVWHAAHAVSGLAALNQGGAAQVTAVSCPARTSGDCTAAGYYNTAGQKDQLGFVISEQGGKWGTLAQIPGQSMLSGEGTFIGINVSSLSCAPGAAGNCAVSGSYDGTGPSIQAFVADSASGVWADAEEIPGTAALNSGGYAWGTSVWCPSAGDCSLGGFYSGAGQQGFVAQQSGGVWADAEPIPGLAAFNAGGLAQVGSLSCASAGNCAATGVYANSSVELLAFVVTETNGVWGDAEDVPGVATLGHLVQTDSGNSVSCWSAGQCSVGGSYSSDTTAGFYMDTFVANQASGTWQTAQEVPGTAALNTGNNATTYTVSCAPGGSCALGGDYRNASLGSKGHEQAFVDSTN